MHAEITSPNQSEWKKSVFAFPPALKSVINVVLHELFKNLHSVTDVIKLIVLVLKCRAEGFKSFPSIFCFNPSPSRGSPVLAQKRHGFSVSNKKIVQDLTVNKSYETYFSSLTLKKKKNKQQCNEEKEEGFL